MYKVFILTTGLAQGGAESQLVQLAQGLKARGWDIRVVSMRAPLAFADTLEEAGIPVESLGMVPGVPDPRALFRLARIVRRERPAIMHTHMVHANFLGRLARILAPVPVLVGTAHSIDEGGWIREWAYRLTDKLGDVTTQVCRAGVERYVRVKAVPRHRIRFIPNGVEVNRFTASDAFRTQSRRELALGDCFAWLAVGRLTEAKDYPNLIQAFARLARQKPTARLLIAGDGPLRESVRNQIAQHGLEPRVRLLGARDDIPRLMSAADGFVLSSACEGLSMALLEAGAAGLPSVTTRVGGCAEAVVEEESAFLVGPQNSEDLFAAMNRLMDLAPARRCRMGKAGRDHVIGHFSMDRILAQWEGLYLELVVDKGSRSLAPLDPVRA